MKHDLLDTIGIVATVLVILGSAALALWVAW